MSNRRSLISIFIALLLVAASLCADDAKKAPPPSQKIPKGAKVFIEPITDGFDTYLKAAITDKKVPIEIVESKDKADYDISGVSETRKASTAKKAIMLNWHSDEEASIQVANLKTGEVAWSYSVHKQSSAHGKKSTAEACAKHLKDDIEK
jgi:hypothetical protein